MGVWDFVKLVLEAIHVSWHLLAFIPKGVLEAIRKLYFSISYGLESANMITLDLKEDNLPK
jgi:hypothetical protein